MSVAVCGADTPHEVFATVRPYDVVVGAAGLHDDYQDFGEGQSDAEIARAAFERFIELLQENGHLDRTV